MNFDDVLRSTRILYDGTATPVALIDDCLNTQWANREALRAFPALSLTNGVRDMLGQYREEEILKTLCSGTAFIVERIPQLLSLTGISIYPILEDGRLLGGTVFLLANTDSQSYIDKRYQGNAVAAFTNEYRMPLTIIFSTLGLMARTTQNETQKNYLRLIAQNSYRLLRLSGNMALAARYSSGISRLTLRNGDICSFVAGLCEAAGILTSAIDIPIEVEIPQKPVVMAFDPGKLAEVFLNLFSNSCKNTRPGNHIKVRLQVQPENVTVTVSDFGIGIPESIMDDIFKPYFSHGRDNLPYGGVGIGLTIVKSIVALHGGSIAMHSRENEGTAVAFTLPLRVDASLPSYTAENSADYLADRFSVIYVGLSDVCGAPLP